MSSLHRGGRFGAQGRHEAVNRMAEEPGVLDVCPSKTEVRGKTARIAKGKRWRPVMMMLLDGAQEFVRPWASV